MKMKKIISMFLAVLFMISVCALDINAAETTAATTQKTEGSETTEPETPTEKVEYTYKTSSSTPTIFYFEDPKQDPKWETSKVTSFNSAEEKLEYMDLRLQKDGYQIYVDEFSGEVAVKCIETGEILSTNPYNIGKTPSKKEYVSAQPSIKYQLMSQIVIKYTDNDTEKYFYSFEQASLRNQIKVKNIKSGIRVEYTLGREEAKMLVPRLIRVDRYEEKLLDVLAEAFKDEGGRDNFLYKKFDAYYQKKDVNEAQTDQQAAQLIASFPICKKMAVYVIDPTTTDVEYARLEAIVKTYCPNYTYEELEYDHEITEYEGEDENPPLFKLALEYTIDEDGLSVRLPANGIRFNESLYQLTYISVLPYMGCGSNPNPGYTFFPDGSGSIFDFQELAALGTTTTINGKVYGQDYAYQTIAGTHQEVIRYPVFGVVETETLTKEDELDPTADPIEYTKDRGYVAIIEEGDSMAELSTYHAGQLSRYNSVQMLYYPRPKDSYNMADAISVGSNTTWTVVSSRKYTGNYKIRYILLTDEEVAKKVQHDYPEGETFEYYSCNYVGMAKAYREYLEKTNVLKKLTEEDVEEKIPLYIQTFGSIETTEKILSIPVDTMVALTSFDNIKTMYQEFKEAGITNINFKLTGYTNGGMFSKMPYQLKWEKAVGGKSGFSELIEYANEEGFKVFPDFDFAYVNETGWFDGLSLQEHAVKTIDNRYTSKREYSATKQTYVGYFQLAISPAYYEHFYTKLTENYLKYFGDNLSSAISVGTLGTELNSDFDEDEPYNREDSKLFTVEAFKFLAEKYDYVMTDGANAYTWKYVDYLVNVPLDSSRYIKASASVPFLGMVLHGYIQFAGTPINMEGNIDYAFLKAIENGSALYFTLSYQNTTKLKENHRLSKYYSVRYDIWYDDVVSLYNELNDVLAELQTELITDHEFVAGTRVPDLDELQNDLSDAVRYAIALELENATKEEKEFIASVLSARQNILSANSTTATQAAALNGFLTEIRNKVGANADGTLNYSRFQTALDDFAKCMADYLNALALKNLRAADLRTAAANLNTAASKVQALFEQNSVTYYAERAYTAESAVRTAYLKALDSYDYLCNDVEGIPEDILVFAKKLLEETAENAATALAIAPEIYKVAQSAYDYVVAQTYDYKDADGNLIFTYAPYQMFLYVLNNASECQGSTKLRASYAINRYEPGVGSGYLTASQALFLVKQALGTSISDAYADKLAAMETAYATYADLLEAYNNACDAYDRKEASEGEVNLARVRLIAQANLLNKTVNDLSALFEGSASKDVAISATYPEETLNDLYQKLAQLSFDFNANSVITAVKATDLKALATAYADAFAAHKASPDDAEKLAAFTAAKTAFEALFGKDTDLTKLANLKIQDEHPYSATFKAFHSAAVAYVTAKSASGTDLAAEEARVNAANALVTAFDAAVAASSSTLQTSGTAASQSFTAVAGQYQYILVAKGALAGINYFATSAQRVLDTMNEGKTVADGICEILNAAAGVPAETLAAAESYRTYIQERYNRSVPDAEEVIRLVNEAYGYVTDTDIYQKYVAAAENDPTAKLVAKVPYFVKTEKVEEEVEETKEDISKYLSDDNNIVLVTYGNGTKFLLNYNNFAVIVVVDGKTYKIDAQDYMILQK